MSLNGSNLKKYIRGLLVQIENQDVPNINYSSIKCQGASKKEILHISYEWSNGLIEASGKNRTSQLSNLRIKIKKHYESVQGLRAFIENNELIPDNFELTLNTIASLPCSTAECEKGFSLMNNIITNLRASLLISNVSSLMFNKSNGPHRNIREVVTRKSSLS